MKLRDMSTEALRNTLCALTGPLCTLAEDPAVQEAFDSLAQTGGSGKRPLQAWAAIVSTLTPLLLQRHRAETLAVASVLLDRPAGELLAQNGLETLCQLRESLDGELLDFFACAAGMAETPSSPCCAAAQAE